MGGVRRGVRGRRGARRCGGGGRVVVARCSRCGQSPSSPPCSPTLCAEISHACAGPTRADKVRLAAGGRPGWAQNGINAHRLSSTERDQMSQQHGELDQLADRPLSMREVPGSKPGFSNHLLVF